MNKEDMNTLESLIDKYSLDDVLSAIREICLDKADHLRTNWQDEQSAKYWESIEKQINKVRS